MIVKAIIRLLTHILHGGRVRVVRPIPEALAKQQEQRQTHARTTHTRP